MPATANPWLAPVGATDPKDSVPAEAPVQVPGLTLTPGTTLSFSATGAVSTFNGEPAYSPPDGDTGSFPTHPAENGLSGVTSNYNSLVGVFINDSPLNANATGTPASLDFSNPASVPEGVDYGTLQPALGQVFFIGDGVTSGNVAQQVVVPAGAMHLALGTIDTDTYSDNDGAFTVTVTANGGVPVNAADLHINESANTVDSPNAAVAIVGDEITYTFTVRNDGKETFTNVKVINQLPSFLHLESADNGYTVDSSNKVTWSFPTLSPTTGTPLTLKLVVSVTSDAFVGKVFNNRSFAVTADGADVQGTDIINTTVVQPLEVIVTSNSASVVPGQQITFKIDVYNRTGGTIKQVSLSIPIPSTVNYVPGSAMILDDAGNVPIPAPAMKDGTADPAINGTNLLAYFGNIKANAKAHLALTVTVPFDVDPTSAIVFAGPQVTTKTSVGGANSFTLPDTSAPLSGLGAVAPPIIGFSKIVADATGILQLSLAQPKLLKNLEKSLPVAAADPAALAQLEKVYPGLATLNPLTATLPDVLAVLNPDVSFETSSVVDGFYATTVAAPTAQKATYVAFVLPYANSGGATATDVVIQDRVPAGMTLYEPGTGVYNGSILINGKPVDPGDAAKLEILDDGRTLRFHVADVKAGKSGFVIYKARVLGPNEAGAPSVDSVLTSSGSVLSSTSLSRTYIGQPDGRDITVTGKYAYFLEPTQYSSNTTGPDQGVVYETRYVNTGTKASKILEIDVPVPAGMVYVGRELYDLNHVALPANGIQPGSTEVPADPTSGTVVFHPPLFTSSGKVAAKDGGIIREFFQPLPNALANGYRVFVHSPTIPATSYGMTNAVSPGVTRVRKAVGPVTRNAVGPATTGASNTTRVDDPSIPRLFIALAMPMSMTEGQTSEVFVAAGSLNGQPLNDFAAGELLFTLPPGVQFGEGEVGTDPAFFSTQKTAAGLTQVQVSFGNGLPANGASVAKFTVKPQSGTAGTTPLVFPGCALGFDPRSPVALQTGPVKVQVLSAADAARLAAGPGQIQGQVTGTALTSVDTSNPLLKDFVSHINGTSRTIIIAGASALSITNGAVVIPLLGSSQNVLAMGPATAVGAQGAARQVKTADFSFNAATGAGMDITVGQATGSGGTMPAQSAAALTTGVGSGTANNGVKLGVVNILNGGASNVVSNDGGSLIGDDGSSLTGVQVSGVIARDGAGLAAGNGNTSGLVSNSSGTLQNAALLIGQDGNGLIATKGGSALAASGANLVSNSSGTLTGTSDNTVALHATASGNLVQVGSTTGLVSNSSGTIVAAGGGN